MALSKRLNKTFQKVYRDRHTVAKEYGLTDREYRLWDLYVALYDWDKKHVDTYQTLNTTDKEIAEILGKGWSSSKVCRTRNLLLRKEALQQISRSRYLVCLMTKSDLADTQLRISHMQDNIADMNNKVTELQKLADQQDQNPLGSFKDKYEDVYINLIKQEQYIRDLLSHSGDFVKGDPKYQKLLHEQQRLSNQIQYYETRITNICSTNNTTRPN